MTTLLEKGQFVTIEFYLDEDQEERYEDGDLDFYYIDILEEDTIEEAILATVQSSEKNVYVSVAPRRYAEVIIEDGNLEDVVDYGDCNWPDTFIYNSEFDTLLEESDHKLIYG